MTKEQILKMKAGPEMDLLVAQVIFGSKAKVIYWSDGTGGFSTSGPVNYGSLPYYIPSGEPFGTQRLMLLPPYSSFIAVAWQVVEKLQEGHMVTIKDCTLDGKDAWRLVLDCDDDNLDGISLTAPEAICKAALIATIEE